MMNRCIPMFAAIFFCCCSSNDYSQRAAKFSQRSPVEEADIDFEKGDYRIYSAMGVGRYFPGLDTIIGLEISQKHGERMLRGITDAIENSSHGEFIEVATKFAAIYNGRKVSLLQSLNK